MGIWQKFRFLPNFRYINVFLARFSDALMLLVIFIEIFGQKFTFNGRSSEKR